MAIRALKVRAIARCTPEEVAAALLSQPREYQERVGHLLARAKAAAAEARAQLEAAAAIEAVAATKPGPAGRVELAHASSKKVLAQGKAQTEAAAAVEAATDQTEAAKAAG